MSDRTGLGPLETAVIRAVDHLSGRASEYVRCADVLDLLEDEGLGPNYLYRVLQDLTVPWRLHLPLLDGRGNFGSPGDDRAADPTYTEVRPSPIGHLALASEHGEVGPLPLALIEGTVYRGGRVPPFVPRTVADTLERLLTDTGRTLTDAELELMIGTPTLPTGGTVTGDLPGLLRGDPAEMRMSTRITAVEREGWQVLEITGYPLGINVDLMLQCITERAAYPNERRGGGAQYVADIQDLTTRISGVRMHIVLRHQADPAEAEAWLRTVWPVSIDTTWQLPAAVSKQLRSAAEALALQPDGLHQLQALL